MKSKKFATLQANLDKAKKYVTIDVDPRSGADIIGDAHELPFKDGEFDIIIANNVIEHFYNPTQAIAEMHRVLKKSGHIYFTVPFLYPIHEAPHDYSRLTRFGLERLFESFKEFEVHARGGWFSTTAHFTYKITHILDKIRLGQIMRIALYPLLWLWVQLDRLDTSDAFVRVYFGKAQK
jgi:ubiquinone/menaquinone biosynthesis C-methylase UbiE